MGVRRDMVDHGNISDVTIEEQQATNNYGGPSRSNGTDALVFEHYEPSNATLRDQSGDVDMG